MTLPFLLFVHSSVQDQGGRKCLCLHPEMNSSTRMLMAVHGSLQKIHQSEYRDLSMAIILAANTHTCMYFFQVITSFK